MARFNHLSEDYLDACGITLDELKKTARASPKLAAVLAYSTIRGNDWRKSKLFDKHPWLGVTQLLFRQSGKKPSEITEAIERVCCAALDRADAVTEAFFENIKSYFSENLLFFSNTPEEPVQFSPSIPFNHKELYLGKALGITPDDIDNAREEGFPPYTPQSIRVMMMIIHEFSHHERFVDYVFTWGTFFSLFKCSSISSHLIELLEMLYTLDERLFLQRFTEEGASL